MVVLLITGIVLGVVGLAVVTARAVRDRRHDVGVLRALGFDAPMVRHMFMVEAGTIAVEGTVLGVALGVVLAWRLKAVGLLGASVSLSVPYLVLALLVVATTVMSVLAARRPASSAAAIPTSDALRTVE